MQHAKSVVKSKSSNSAITSKPKTPDKNKKSQSSAQVLESDANKRGVFIERRIAVDEPQYSSSRRYSKLFTRPTSSSNSRAQSVLIRDTSSSQQTGKFTGKSRKVIRRVGVATVDRSTQDLDALYTLTPKVLSPINTRKQKYRSRVLNGNIDDKFEVLKPKNDLFRTPSYSNRDLSVRKQSEHPVTDNEVAIYKHVDDYTPDTAKDENKSPKKPKVLRIEEPATLMGEYNAEPRKSIYNFFVDLLETTIDVYNADCNMNPSLSQMSKKMEIEENVANKLDLVKKTEASDAEYYRRNNVFYITDDDRSTDKIQVYKTKPLYTNMNPPTIIQRKSMPKALNMSPTKFPIKTGALSISTHTQKPKKLRKVRNKKQTLLNMFKEELKMDDDAFEEPQSLHEALTIIAKNQRHCQRAIHFDEASIKKSTDGRPCMFRRRKIISSSNNSTTRNKNFKKYNYRPPVTPMASFQTGNLPRKIPQKPSISSTESEEEALKKNNYESALSLEVKAYDYDINDNIKDIVARNNKHDTNYTEVTTYEIKPLHSLDSIRSESIASNPEFCIEDISYHSQSRESTTLSQLLLGTSVLNLL